MRALDEVLTGKLWRSGWAGFAAGLLLGSFACTAARNTRDDGGAAGQGGAGGHAMTGNRDGGADHRSDAKPSGDRPLLAPDAAVTTCEPGSHNCAGMGCVSDDSTAHCASSCSVCTPPDGGVPSCGGDGGTCDFTCTGSLKKCGGSCVAGCCIDSDCPPQNGKAGQCDTSTYTCSYQNCATGNKVCGTTCIPDGNCCVSSDCKTACSICSSGSCVPVTNADDPVLGRCAGTCDSAGACKSKRGQTCTTVAGLCLGGLFCSPDNYCCDRACTGPCEACDVVGSVGTCTTVADGPHVGHTGCQGSNATCSGSCSGSVNGQCVWPTGSCGQASCTNQSGNTGTSYVAAGACSVGACGAGNSSACGGGLLCASSTACKTSCAADADCLTGDYCAGGTCATKGGNGATCAGNTQCGSGACVDSVCCESACPGLCMACSSAKTGNTDGLCRGVKAGTDPDSECAVDSTNACGQDGTCDGSGGCRLQQNGISCGNSSCANANFTAAGRCNGTGTCIPASGSMVCAGSFACGSSTTCGTTCSEASTGGCVSGYECLNGACVPATVPCGGPACAVANGGGQCCVTDPNNTGTNAVLSCLPAGSTCGGAAIICNGKSDCPTGQYCCAAGNGCSPGHYSTYCTASVSSCVGGTMSFGYQVCDPAVNSGKECVTGTCKSDTACIPGLSVCS